jgi:serpin B
MVSACASSRDAHSDVARESSPQVPDADAAELVRQNTDLAFSLYRRISADEGNVFLSPYSISIALAMTYAGAEGKTAEQMAQALRFTLPPERLHPAFNRLALDPAAGSAAEAGSDPAFQLNVANSIWGQTGYPFRQEYLDALALHYGAGLRLADFAGDAGGARREINDWVSQATNRKIQDIIPEGALNALTRLVLADAVYFKAAWQYPFDADGTRPAAFHLPDRVTTDVSMMRREAGLSYLRADGYAAVELPYAGGRCSMLILLPDEGRFGEVESRLDSGLLDSILAAMEHKTVALAVPKFSFEWSSGLTDGLKDLGMTDAFDPAAADFSGIDGKRDLFVSDVLHKSFVAVDEAGTEAAAATVVIMPSAALPDTPVEFTADRPFFFLIRDNPTGTILFLGRVTNPAA